MGIAPSAWRPFFSVASVIGVINSMVAGALTGVAFDAFASRATALIVGIAVVIVAGAGHYRFGFRRFTRALESFEPIFPHSDA